MRLPDLILLFFGVCVVSDAQTTDDSLSIEMSSGLERIRTITKSTQVIQVCIKIMSFDWRAQDTVATFSGGRNGIDDFVKHNMEWNFKRIDYKGTVYVRCVVTKTGELSDIEISKGLCEACDKEALRLVRIMSDWKPAIKDGKPIASTVLIPISFRVYD